jgi:hypothetical protein
MSFTKFLSFCWQLWPHLRRLYPFLLDAIERANTQSGIQSGSEKRDWVFSRVMETLPVKFQANPAAKWLVNLGIEFIYGWASGKLRKL